MNKNIGISKGCAAGRAGVALDVDGNWIPCRHLLKPESYQVYMNTGGNLQF